MSCHCKNKCKNNCCCIQQCVIPIPPNNNLKTVALLELSGPGVDSYDIALKTTFEYYFKNSNQFKSFPIIDTGSELQKTLDLLDYYYIAGYRIFIGFSRSSLLTLVKPWFDNHPSAIGISPNSTSPTLDIPKNIYRLSPSDDNILSNIQLSPYLLSRRNIFYIYSKGEIATETVLALMLNPLSPIKDKVKPIPIEPDSSNINDVQTIYNLNNYDPLQDAAVDYLFIENQRNDFINLFSLSFIPIPTFDISVNTYPIFNDTEKLIWNNFYYCFQNINVSTSPLWRQGYETLGYYDYNTIGLNALQLNNFLKTKTNLNELSNYAFVQQFDANKDTIYFSYSDFKYVYDIVNNKQTWIPDSVFVKDPIFGTFYKTF